MASPQCGRCKTIWCSKNGSNSSKVTFYVKLGSHTEVRVSSVEFQWLNAIRVRLNDLSFLHVVHYYAKRSVRFQTEVTQLRWWEDQVHKKDVWKFSTTESGELCVMMDLLMQQLESSATLSDSGT